MSEPDFPLLILGDHLKCSAKPANEADPEHHQLYAVWRGQNNLFVVSGNRTG
jgi:hypothetical protein